MMSNASRPVLEKTRLLASRGCLPKFTAFDRVRRCAITNQYKRFLNVDAPRKSHTISPLYLHVLRNCICACDLVQRARCTALRCKRIEKTTVAPPQLLRCLQFRYSVENWSKHHRPTSLPKRVKMPAQFTNNV